MRLYLTFTKHPSAIIENRIDALILDPAQLYESLQARASERAQSASA